MRRWARLKAVPPLDTKTKRLHVGGVEGCKRPDDILGLGEALFLRASPPILAREIA